MPVIACGHSGRSSSRSHHSHQTVCVNVPLSSILCSVPTCGIEFVQPFLPSRPIHAEHWNSLPASDSWRTPGLTSGIVQAPTTRLKRLPSLDERYAPAQFRLLSSRLPPNEGASRYWRKEVRGSI